ncbi:hypothetical protein AB0399_05115, partial [Streptomyces sp. NPDC088194]|uniref:hypothetical protein n=1 Tax=Streptomyces sp. NPDC088194 TaxID=3154931 RepID=UPI0034500A28
MPGTPGPRRLISATPATAAGRPTAPIGSSAAVGAQRGHHHSPGERDRAMSGGTRTRGRPDRRRAP